jgi:hypothetical protein
MTSVAVAGAAQAASSRINDRRTGVICTANLRGDFLFLLFILPPNIYKVRFTDPAFLPNFFLLTLLSRHFFYRMPGIIIE